MIINMLSNNCTHTINILNYQHIVGLIQISNRFYYILYIYGKFDIISNQFNAIVRILNIIEQLLNDTAYLEYSNILENKIVYSCLHNFKAIFNNNNNYYEITATINNMINNFNGNHKSLFFDKYNHTLNHWLFFFNKINSNSYFSHISSLEDDLRQKWTDKLLNTNYFDVDLSEISFELKFYILVEDKLFKLGDQYEEDEEQIKEFEELSKFATT